MKYKFKDLIHIRKKKQRTSKISLLFYQHISNILLWVFLNLKISAYQISGMMAFITILASLLYLTANKTYLILGSVLFIFAMILDHTDGDAARITKSFSRTGPYFDIIHHILEETILFFGLGLYLFKISENLNFLYIGIFISLSIIALHLFKIIFLFMINIPLTKDSVYRKFPLVLMYGEFFKIWHILLLISLLAGFSKYILFIAFIWSLVRSIHLPIFFYIELSKYEKGNNMEDLTV